MAHHGHDDDWKGDAARVQARTGVNIAAREICDREYKHAFEDAYKNAQRQEWTTWLGKSFLTLLEHAADAKRDTAMPECEITFDVKNKENHAPTTLVALACAALEKRGYITDNAPVETDISQHDAFDGFGRQNAESDTRPHIRRVVMQTPKGIILKEKSYGDHAPHNGITARLENERSIGPDELVTTLGGMMEDWKYLGWWKETSASQRVIDPTERHVYCIAADEVVPYGRRTPLYRLEVEYLYTFPQAYGLPHENPTTPDVLERLVRIDTHLHEWTVCVTQMRIDTHLRNTDSPLVQMLTLATRSKADLLR
jgi:hypothetical protein